MLNDAYRRLRGTHKPFRATEAEIAAEYERIYPEAVKRARERRLNPKRKQIPWGHDFSLED